MERQGLSSGHAGAADRGRGPQWDACRCANAPFVPTLLMLGLPFFPRPNYSCCALTLMRAGGEAAAPSSAKGKGPSRRPGAHGADLVRLVKAVKAKSWAPVIIFSFARRHGPPSSPALPYECCPIVSCADPIDGTDVCLLCTTQTYKPQPSNHPPSNHICPCT